MIATLFTWEPVVELVAQDHLESQQQYSADYQFVNIKTISASHKAMFMVMVS